MATGATRKVNFMEFGIAAAAVDGQGESGDTHVVQYEQDSVLVAAIDGIGHGASAAAAALAASSVLKSHAAETLETVVQMCHDELRSTRGAVMSLASISPRLGQMRWLGVGNVQGVVQRAGAAKGSGQEVLLLRAGVVGAQMPSIQAATVSLHAGDTIVFATDGVQSEFVADVFSTETPQRCADRILRQHFRGNDDALVLVARYLGKMP
jgi:serine phosphatase RsbU (regulator of sigma subunit)